MSAAAACGRGASTWASTGPGVISPGSFRTLPRRGSFTRYPQVGVVKEEAAPAEAPAAKISGAGSSGSGGEPGAPPETPPPPHAGPLPHCVYDLRHRVYPAVSLHRVKSSKSRASTAWRGACSSPGGHGYRLVHLVAELRGQAAQARGHQAHPVPVLLWRGHGPGLALLRPEILARLGEAPGLAYLALICILAPWWPYRRLRGELTFPVHRE